MSRCYNANTRSGKIGRLGGWYVYGREWRGGYGRVVESFDKRMSGVEGPVDDVEMVYFGPSKEKS